MKTLENLFQSFENGIRSAKAIKPKQFLDSIGLDYNTQRIGFNSGQFHNGESVEVKKHYESLGVLTKSTAPVRDESMEAYTVFGRYGIVFPLFDSTGRIINLYAYRFDMASPQEDYLNDLGLYPNYPHPNTKRLFIVPTVIDAASLLQSRALENKEAVLALHDGKLLLQHKEAIAVLENLEEIILIKR